MEQRAHGQTLHDQCPQDDGEADHEHGIKDGFWQEHQVFETGERSAFVDDVRE